MRLTSKQLKIVVEEVYNKVSLPIVEANQKAIDEVKLGNYDYFQDLKKVNKLKDKIKLINKEIEELEEKYEGKTIDGFEFSTFRVFQLNELYTVHLKKKLANLKPFLTQNEIEKQVILAGNRDIPTLIEELIIKLSK